MIGNVVLDTNVLIMAISVRSPYFDIWKAFLRGDYTLCISNDILEEYAEVLARNISAKVSENIISAILFRPNVKRFDPHFSFYLISSDIDDNKFSDCAIVANAEFIVTEDKHFRELQKISFPKITCIDIDEFYHICKKELRT